VRSLAVTLMSLACGCSPSRSLPVCIDMDPTGRDAAVAGIGEWGVRVEARAAGELCAVSVEYGTGVGEVDPDQLPYVLGYTRVRKQIVVVRGDVRSVVSHEFGHVLGLTD
jgi:hypothetical protein